jgi:CRP-like cAMP-binding protein
MAKTQAGNALSPSAGDAWSNSPLGMISISARDSLLEDAREVHIEAGDTMQTTEAVVTPQLIGLVVDGLIRIYVQSPEGREITVRYALYGDLVGLPAAIGTEFGSSNRFAQAQSVTSTHLVLLPAKRFVALAAKDASVAWPIAQYVADTLHGMQERWISNFFLPMVPRLAHHLLDLAVRERGALVVRATQQELASAIGSVREVVARTLRDLTDQDLIARTPEGIVLLRPAELHRMVSASATISRRAAGS